MTIVSYLLVYCGMVNIIEMENSLESYEEISIMNLLRYVL